MEKLTKAAQEILIERFGKDSVIALATAEDGVPHVRSVNAFYDEKAFYVITHGRSRKMRQIEKKPVVAIAGDWFTAHGKGINLGFLGKRENAEIAQKLRAAFAAWIDNGHNDLNDENTCILCIRLTDGLLFSHGTKYEIDFSD